MFVLISTVGNFESLFDGGTGLKMNQISRRIPTVTCTGRFSAATDRQTATESILLYFYTLLVFR